MTFVVFDLDDTLYLERDFVFSGFRAVGNRARDHHGIDGLEEACRSVFAAGERQRVFDEAFLRLSVVPEADLIGDMVETYRGHTPQIALQADADRALQRYAGRCGLISDGPAATQGAKLSALNLEDRLSPILLTGALGQNFGKPSPMAFELMEEATGLTGRALTYVADNPIKDFITPRRMGWQTVMIARPQRIHRSPPPTADHDAAHRIPLLDALDECVTWPEPARKWHGGRLASR